MTDAEKREKHLEQMREWRRTHKEHQRELTYKWRAEHPERWREIQDKHDSSHHEERLAQHRAYYRRRKEKLNNEF